jgi:hypothetical protein
MADDDDDVAWEHLIDADKGRRVDNTDTKKEEVYQMAKGAMLARLQSEHAALSEEAANEVSGSKASFKASNRLARTIRLAEKFDVWLRSGEVCQHPLCDAYLQVSEKGKIKINGRGMWLSTGHQSYETLVKLWHDSTHADPAQLPAWCHMLAHVSGGGSKRKRN